jgi:hypothetical protein
VLPDPDPYDIVDPASRARIMALIEADIGPFAGADADARDDGSLVEIARFNPYAGVHSISRMPIEHMRCLPVPPGFAYPVHAASRDPFDGVYEYLLSEADKGDRATTGRWGESTVRTYAYLLRPVCEALALEGRPYEYLDDDVMDLVVSSMLEGVNRRGQPLSPETIEQTIAAACRCVAYTNRIGATSIGLDRDALLGRAYGLRSVYDRDGRRLDRDRLLGARRHMIRPLSDADVARLKEAMPVTASNWVEGGPSCRPRMTFDTGRRCGIRVVENLGIHAADVRAMVIAEADREYPFTLKRTKGADHREAVVLGHDVLEWQAYDRGERRVCIDAARRLHGEGWVEPVQLFVNGLSAGRHVGEAVQPSSIQRDFREAQRGLGMYGTIDVPGPDGTTTPVVVYDHCYHDLRHTKAQKLYRIAVESPDHRHDPVAFVCVRLGHAHPSTTSRIYLWPDKRKVAAVGDAARRATRGVIDAR